MANETWTADNLLLEAAEKKKKALKNDIILSEKIERTKEQFAFLSLKQKNEFQNIERVKNHYRKEEEAVRQAHYATQLSLQNQFETARMKYEAAVERDNKELDRKLQYYQGRYEECDQKLEDILKTLEDKTKQVERRQERLVNQVVTPAGKKMVKEILSSDEEETSPPPPPPPKPQGGGGVVKKIGPKKVGVKVVKIVQPDLTQEQKEADGRQLIIDAKEEAYLLRQQSAILLEKEMMNKNSLLKKAKAELEDLNQKLPLPEEDIFLKENEIAVLKKEINFIYEQMPKEFRK